MFLLVVIFLISIEVFVLSKKIDSLFATLDSSVSSVQHVTKTNKDLVSFSLISGSTVSGKLEIMGAIAGGYFNEGSMPVTILDADKKILKITSATAKSDWTTAAPILFTSALDFTGLPKGPAFIELHNDNPSGMPQNDKSILIPIVIS